MISLCHMLIQKKIIIISSVIEILHINVIQCQLILILRNKRFANKRWCCSNSQFVESTSTVCCALFLSPLLLISLFCLSSSNSVFLMLILDPFFSLFDSLRVSSGALFPDVATNSKPSPCHHFALLLLLH